jgi:hypothetical protein
MEEENVGFWGADGFTFDDLGGIIDLTGDTLDQVGDMAGWWETDPETGDEYFVPAEYSEPTNYTPYIIGGSIILAVVIAILIYYMRKRRKK